MIREKSGCFSVMFSLYVIFFFFVALQTLGVLNPSVPVQVLFLHLLMEKVINVVEMIAELN